eukprot:9475126-Pyramimonas_sp.AAC.1
MRDEEREGKSEDEGGAGMREGDRERRTRDTRRRRGGTEERRRRAKGCNINRPRWFDGQFAWALLSNGATVKGDLSPG